MTEGNAPTKRRAHQSAFIDGKIYLFGGKTGKLTSCASDAIYVLSCRERKWIRRQATGLKLDFIGGRCVAIDGIIYTYNRDENVSRLDPSEMEWKEVSVEGEKKPRRRADCYLLAIGSGLIMFGGSFVSRRRGSSHNRLQSGASHRGDVNNEIYEFEFGENKGTGLWVDLELAGARPEPRAGGAVATVDQYRGVLHGGWSGDDKKLEDLFVIDLRNKTWSSVDFASKLSGRCRHTLCSIPIEGLEDKVCLFLIGGCKSDSALILDIDESLSYELKLDRSVATVYKHSAHCILNDDQTASLFLCGGSDASFAGKFKSILTVLEFDALAKYVKIKRDIFLSLPSPTKTREELTTELKQLKQKVESHQSDLYKSETRCNWLTHFNEEVNKEVAHKDAQLRALQEELHDQKSQHEVTRNDLKLLRQKLEEEASRVQSEQLHCKNLKASLHSSERRLNEFVDALSIKSEDVQLSSQKLGSGAFADVYVGNWQGSRVAVKKFHQLLMTPRNSLLFQQEVLICSRLHHPKILIVYGAVIENRIPFQIVAELLEGSVEEVIDAAHYSECYLTNFEQISIAVDMASGIAYLHQLRPKPYVHSDIRSTNVFVTNDMTAKVGDLGASHALESSRSMGPLSRQYIAPERMPRVDGTAAHSSLESDVFCLGVTLIELFTGEAPVPDERHRQLDRLAKRRELYELCSRMISDERRARPEVQSCFGVLKAEKKVAECGDATKRTVQSAFEGDKHKVVLSFSSDV